MIFLISTEINYGCNDTIYIHNDLNVKFPTLNLQFNPLGILKVIWFGGVIYITSILYYLLNLIFIIFLQLLFNSFFQLYTLKL
jgi:hypothetical protein